MFTKLISGTRYNCADLYNCCSCGGAGDTSGGTCGCAYCWDCHACDSCLNEDDNQPCELVID